MFINSNSNLYIIKILKSVKNIPEGQIVLQPKEVKPAYSFRPLCRLHVCSVVSDSLQPHELQPARLLCPWNFPGKKTGVGGRSQDGGGIGRGDHFLSCKFIERTIEH